MDNYMMGKLQERFHGMVFETGASDPGVVLKLPDMYFKIYNARGPHYYVQTWSYGPQLPDQGATVRMEDLFSYIEGVICTRRRCY